MTTRLPYRPILKYPGAKWSRASWIVAHFPPHSRYVEPYCGSAARFFSKTPVAHEVLGDTNQHLLTLFDVIRNHGEELARRIALSGWLEADYLRCEHAEDAEQAHDDDPIEQARRFLVRCWQAHGTKLGATSGWRHKGIRGAIRDASSTTELWTQLPERILAVVERLKQAEIRCRPALELIAYYNSPEVLLYVDPPYVQSTRTHRLYAQEMRDEEHRTLLEVLDAHRGAVVLSGYAHPLYDERLTHWTRLTMPALAEHGKRRTEVLWLNARAARGVRWTQQVPLFGEEEARCVRS